MHLDIIQPLKQTCNYLVIFTDSFEWLKVNSASLICLMVCDNNIANLENTNVKFNDIFMLAMGLPS